MTRLRERTKLQSRVVIDLSGADTRLAEMRRKTPGGAALSAESAKALRDRDSEGPGKAGGSPPTALKPRGGGAVTSGAVVEGDPPLKGEKPKGGTGRPRRFGDGTATDFRGDESPGGERGSAGASAADPSEPTPGGQARPGGADHAAEGEPFEGQNPMRASD